MRYWKATIGHSGTWSAAAIRSRDGRIWTGLHIGTTVGRLSVCAEAVAFGRALLDGDGTIQTAVAVRHPKPEEEDRELAVVRAVRRLSGDDPGSCPQCADHCQRRQCPDQAADPNASAASVSAVAEFRLRRHCGGRRLSPRSSRIPARRCAHLRSPVWRGEWRSRYHLDL